MAKQETTNNGRWELAPSSEAVDHVELQSSYDLFIGGNFVPSAQGKRFSSVNPATEDVIAEVTEATADIEDATSVHHRFGKKLVDQDLNTLLRVIAGKRGREA